jgi:hypothetical protein
MKVSAMKLSRLEFLKAVAIGGIGSIFLAATKTTSAAAGECCKCGCPQATRVCRRVCEEKKVTVTLWGVAEEDFCVPGPSKPGCEYCEMVGDPKENDKTPCYSPKKLAWTEWLPSGCPTLFTKKKLMKKTVTKTVPTYKWVVEDLCAECEEKATGT